MALTAIFALKVVVKLMPMCRCNEGYEGANCHVAATSSTELPLLVSLSTLLPIAAVLVVIVAIVSIYRRLKSKHHVIGSHRQHRDTVRARYDAMCSSISRYHEITYG